MKKEEDARDPHDERGRDAKMMMMMMMISVVIITRTKRCSK